MKHQRMLFEFNGGAYPGAAVGGVVLTKLKHQTSPSPRRNVMYADSAAVCLHLNTALLLTACGGDTLDTYIGLDTSVIQAVVRNQISNLQPLRRRYEPRICLEVLRVRIVKSIQSTQFTQHA
jgi:hypothetical protein